MTASAAKAAQTVVQLQPAVTTTATKAEATPHAALPALMLAAAHHVVHVVLLKNF